MALAVEEVLDPYIAQGGDRRRWPALVVFPPAAALVEGRGGAGRRMRRLWELKQRELFIFVIYYSEC